MAVSTYKNDRRALALVDDRAVATLRISRRTGIATSESTLFTCTHQLIGNKVAVRVGPVNTLPCAVRITVGSVFAELIMERDSCGIVDNERIHPDNPLIL